MRNIVNRSFNVYPKEVFENWDNDVSIFTDFEKHIEDSLQDTIEKLENGFW